tara:strand:+ start:253 stop:654 length:402 start_codon:yes stop_codon:yes gene_type:complete
MEDLSDKLTALIRAGHIKQAKELCEALGTTVGAKLHNVSIWQRDIGTRRKSGRTAALCQLANEAVATGKLCEFYNVEHSVASLRGKHYQLSEKVQIHTWELGHTSKVSWAVLYQGERVVFGPPLVWDFTRRMR